MATSCHVHFHLTVSSTPLSLLFFLWPMKVVREFRHFTGKGDKMYARFGQAYIIINYLVGQPRSVTSLMQSTITEHEPRVVSSPLKPHDLMSQDLPSVLSSNLMAVISNHVPQSTTAVFVNWWATSYWWDLATGWVWSDISKMVSIFDKLNTCMYLQKYAPGGKIDLKKLSFEIWRRAVWCTDVSEECTAFIFRAEEYNSKPSKENGMQCIRCWSTLLVWKPKLKPH
jgi:hypothetical protein